MSAKGRPRRRLARRRSVIAGWGVYALEPIAKNTKIVTYDGERISHRESRRREARQLPRGRIWCLPWTSELSSMLQSAATWRGSSTTRASRTATHRSSMGTSGFVRRAISARGKSSRTTTTRAARPGFPASAGSAVKRSCESRIYVESCASSMTYFCARRPIWRTFSRAGSRSCSISPWRREHSPGPCRRTRWPMRCAREATVMKRPTSHTLRAQGLTVADLTGRRRRRAHAGRSDR